MFVYLNLCISFSRTQWWQPVPAVRPRASLLCAVGWRWELTNLQSIMVTHVSVTEELWLYLARPPSVDTHFILFFRGSLLQVRVLHGPLPAELV